MDECWRSESIVVKDPMVRCATIVIEGKRSSSRFHPSEEKKGTKGELSTNNWAGTSQPTFQYGVKSLTFRCICFGLYDLCEHLCACVSDVHNTSMRWSRIVTPAFLCIMRWDANTSLHDARLKQRYFCVCTIGYIHMSRFLTSPNASMSLFLIHKNIALSCDKWQWVMPNCE